MKNPSRMPRWCIEKCCANTKHITVYELSSSIALCRRRLMWMSGAHMRHDTVPVYSSVDDRPMNTRFVSDTVEVNNASAGSSSQELQICIHSGAGCVMPEMSKLPEYTSFAGITSISMTTAAASSASSAANRCRLRISECSCRTNRTTHFAANMPAMTSPYELGRHNSIMLSTSRHGFSSRFFQLMATSSMAATISA